MSEVILVVLQRPEAALGLLRAAERLAVLSDGARISVLAVHTPLGLTIMMNDGSIPAETLKEMAAEEDERMAMLRATFGTWATEPRAASIPTKLSIVDGPPERPIVDRGQRADFIVAARPCPEDDWKTRQTFQAALFRTERPVLVVPPGSETVEFGRRVVIAWRDDGRAAKAVLPALRCLIHAEQVFVLSGVREGKPRPGVPDIVAEHGIVSEQRVLSINPGVFGEKLLFEAHTLGADLLVMGAYVHSPLREMIFGGLTRFMLAHADLPILMRH